MSAADDVFTQIDQTLSQYVTTKNNFKAKMDQTTQSILEKIKDINKKMTMMDSSGKELCNNTLRTILTKLNETLKNADDQDLSITAAHTDILKELNMLTPSTAQLAEGIGRLKPPPQAQAPQQGGRNRRRTKGGFIYKKRNSRSKSKSRSSRRKYRSKSSRTR